MAAMSRMLPLVAFSTFAIFLLALLATPTSALSNAGGHPHHSRGHDSIAKRKRSPVKRAKRCRPQSSTLPAAATTSSAAPASTEAADPQTTAEPSTTKAPETTKAATTSAAAATTTSISSGGGGGTVNSSKKLLLAWPNGPTDLEKYKGDNVAGMYTWSPYCPDNAKSIGIDCWPMLWGTKQKSVFTPNADTSAGQLIFGFNEPNQGDQANMNAQDGAALWNSMIRPLADKGCKLVSPATTSAPSGKKWIQDMLAACGGNCGFDYIALHWYGTKTEEFKAYVDDWYSTFGIPIIISEYACQNFSGGAQCSKSETETFHYTMGEWFDQHPGVAMYAPFGFMHDMYNVNYDNQLMGSDGGPNKLGLWYLHH